MAIGIQQDGPSVSSWAGSIALDLERVMNNIAEMQAFLTATADATLEAAPYSFAAADVSTLKSAFTDLSQLAAVYHGSATQATAYDFRTFSKLLRGASCW